MSPEYNKTTRWDDKKITDVVIELDKNQKLWEYKYSFDDISLSLWVIFRVELFDILLMSLCNNKPLDIPIRVSFFKKIEYCFQAYKHRIRAKPIDVLFISPVTQSVDVSSKSFNIYHEPLLQETLKRYSSLLIEEPKLYGKFHPDFSAYKSSMTFDYILSLTYGYCAYLQAKRHQNTINNFVEELVANLRRYSINFEATELVQRVFKKLLKLYLMGKTFLKIIHKTTPTLIITQDLCYGGNKAIMVALAKKNNIKIIEDQHGMISKDYVGYNYGAVYDTIFIPSTILLWGEYWADKLNLDCTKFILGNSRFEQKTVAKKHENSAVPVYLIVPDSKDTAFTKQVVTRLITLFSTSHLLFRCHPREFNSVNLKYGEILSANNVSLDKKSILDTLSQVDMVIAMGSYVSTTVYEALSLGKSVVYIKSTDDVIGLDTVAEYVTVFSLNNITDISAVVPKAIPDNLAEKFMSKNWQRNWLSFLDTHLEKSDAV